MFQIMGAHYRIKLAADMLNMSVSGKNAAMHVCMGSAQDVAQMGEGLNLYEGVQRTGDRIRKKCG